MCEVGLLLLAPSSLWGAWQEPGALLWLRGWGGASASTAVPAVGAPAMGREEGATCEVNVV